MAILKWLKLGAALFNAVMGLRVMLENVQTLDPQEVEAEIREVLQAVESVAKVEIPVDLVDQLVAADVAIIKGYYQQKG